jgi:hypothetical protein
MHTDVEFHRLDGIPNRILRRDRGLNRDRALHRSDCAGEEKTRAFLAAHLAKTPPGEPTKK